MLMIRRATFTLLTLFLAAQLLNSVRAKQPSLPVGKAAPEFHDGVWYNTPTPLKIQNLRGSVVLLEMWTFDCINCIHTLPQMIAWHDTYQDQGLVVIGNHYPEFDFEADPDNLRKAMARLGVTYPVIQDNGRVTWDAYQNHYWPTMYLIDKQGNVRYGHIGEGAYEQTEQAIQMLLAEPYTPDETAEPAPVWSITPDEEVNVRSGPGTDYGVIGRLLPGESTYVLDVDVDKSWYHIGFNGADAYVSAEFVTEAKIE